MALSESLLRPDLQLAMFSGMHEILICGEQRQVVADAELRDQYACLNQKRHLRDRSAL